MIPRASEFLIVKGRVHTKERGLKMIRQVEYFDQAGEVNTERCLQIAEGLITACEDVVLASTSGQTGLKFAKRLGKKTNLIVVTHAFGVRQKNEIEISSDTRQQIEKLGGKVFTGTILTSSLEKSLITEFHGICPTLIIAETLRRFGQGMKVCAEIVMEACDAGLIREEKDVVAVAGSDWGSDTVCMIQSACSRRFLDLKIREILAKPRDF